MNKIKSLNELLLDELTLLLELPLTREKIQVFSKNDYEENKELRHYNLTEQSILIVPPGLMNDVIHAVKNENFDQEKPLEYLKDSLALKDHSFTDETVYLFLDPKDYSLAPLTSDYEVSELEDTMMDTFETFTKACSQEDLDEGLVSLEDSFVLGCFHKKKLIAVASYWFLTDHLADIGVVVHPDYRKKGIGRGIVSRLSQWGIKQGKINMYRHDRKNQKSRRLALSLGFEEYITLEVLKETK